MLFDPWWNPAVEAQAIDRTHRIGQDRTVIAYRLLARGTIEEKIWELQQRKAALAREVLGEDGFARDARPRRARSTCSTRRRRPNKAEFDSFVGVAGGWGAGITPTVARSVIPSA